MTVGLTVAVHEPLATNNGFMNNIIVDSYTHTISVGLGYDTMSMSIGPGIDDILSWIHNGLMRHIEVYDFIGSRIWEGFVNEISAQFGQVSMRLGPIMDITNRAKIAYQTVNYNTNPPIGGERVESSWVDNADSQVAYGVFESVLNGGEGNSTQMLQALDTYIAEFAWPQPSYDISLSGSNLSLTIECLGYAHTYGRFFYQQVASSGQVNASTKLSAVVTAAPFSSTDFGDVIANTLQVGQYEEGNSSGLDVINNIVALGDASDNRYTFMVFDDRKPYYNLAPTDAEYYLRAGKIISRLDEQSMIEPWSIRPFRWIVSPELSVEYPNTGNIRKDPGAIFIEKVTYTAPYGLQITGGKYDTFAQRLAKLNL